MADLRKNRRKKGDLEGEGEKSSMWQSRREVPLRKVLKRKESPRIKKGSTYKEGLGQQYQENRKIKTF